MGEIFEKNPSPGDIVFTDRGLYKHYGIYVGHDSVIHFAGPKGHEIEASRADIIETSVEDFLRGDLLEIQDDDGREPLPKREIIRRARSKLYSCKGDYSLLFNNCEHFANWCRYDEHTSSQVEAGINMAKFLLVTIGTGVLFGLKMAKKDIKSCN